MKSPGRFTSAKPGDLLEAVSLPMFRYELDNENPSSSRLYFGYPGEKFTYLGEVKTVNNKRALKFFSPRDQNLEYVYMEPEDIVKMTICVKAE